MTLRVLAFAGLFALAICGGEGAGGKYCGARGGCDCDCSWASPSTCGQDDGSCCWGCCCQGPSPTPPSPTPPWPPSPTPPSPGHTLYCPGQNDWSGLGGGTQWQGSGWRMAGSGGVHGKASFNLLGGYVEFDMDTSSAQPGINTNFYTSSPSTCCAYCDIQPNGSPQCMEMDIIEANGNCAMQTTWHTWPNRQGGCDEAGCGGIKTLPGGKFHMRANFAESGYMSVTLNGATVNVNPAPSSDAVAKVASTMRSVGAQFHSTQWQGWVPSGGSCPGWGNLGSSVFSVSNVRVMGTVVQGQEPQRCSGLLVNTSMVPPQVTPIE